MERRIALNESLLERAREAAAAIADGVWEHIDAHTTDSVERATLRLMGIEGVNEVEVPLVNIVVEQARELLPGGVILPFVDLMTRSGLGAQRAADGVAAGDLTLAAVPAERRADVEERATRLAREGVARIDRVRERRAELVAETSEAQRPYLYVIVATGNIKEDAVQAGAAARAGADVVAVIRTTAQSLLDYVPYGVTTEGFGGTYATQENFRYLRAALDEVGEEVGRYIRLCNYASGLCMPEIATMGALERLDMMLNDSMYGIIFRNINMKRTFVDQYLARMVNARAGIIINTGEDNYLTTADAFEQAHTVVSSDFINEEFALRAGLEPWQIGLGHAFEIDPSLPDQVVYQIADALLVRQCFPDYPLKYMPPTKYMPGDIFQGHVIDAMFNFTGIFTGQDIMLLGMLTEALHTPLLQDRYLSLRNARYLFEGCRHLMGEVDFRPGGIVETRANEVLERAVAQLEHVVDIGLFKALERGEFADVKRDPEGGRGRDGVVVKAVDYCNPFYAELRGGRPPRPPPRPAARGRPGPRRGHRGEARMIVKPYGDTRDDGVMQFSFTLPIAYSPKAPDIGKQLLEKLGFREVAIAEARGIDPDFTFFVAYGRAQVGIDPDVVKGDYLDVEVMDFYAVNAFIREHLGRRVSVVGAAIESDAHTVGIDAILNMKGVAGNYGLERYPEMEVLNMGSQIPCEQLLRTALERDADAILVSQIVTQKNIHVQNLTKLIELLEAEGVRERFIMIVGGPRINNAFAKELGYDAGFGPRTSPVEVASFLAHEVRRREAVRTST